MRASDLGTTCAARCIGPTASAAGAPTGPTAIPAGVTAKTPLLGIAQSLEIPWHATSGYVEYTRPGSHAVVHALPVRARAVGQGLGRCCLRRNEGRVGRAS